MVIDELAADMGSVRMAVFAGKVPFHSRNGNTAPGNHVIAGLMAVLTPEIQSAIRSPHVHVMIFGRIGQFGTHVTVFDRITATTAKVAVHSAGGPAGPSHVLGDRRQVQVLYRKTGSRRCLFILAGGIMADQAVNFGCITEIEILILPAIPDVAAGPTGPVAIQVDTKVVDGCRLLAQIDAFFVSHRVWRSAMPVPMAGMTSNKVVTKITFRPPPRDIRNEFGKRNVAPANPAMAGSV